MPGTESKSRRMIAYVGILIVNFMAMYLISSVGVYSYTVAEVFNNLPSVSMVFTLECVARSVSIPIGGKVGDKVGHKKLFLFAVTLYIICYAVAAFATSFWMFTIARMVSGFAWGLFMMNGFVLLSAIFGQADAPKYSGYNQSLTTVAMIIGAPIAGVVCAINWRLQFYVAVVLLIIGLVLCAYGIPAIPPKVAGIFFVVLVYVINLMDIKAVAMFQKVITWILLGCLAMIIVVGIFNLNYNPFDFSDPELFTNGFTGVADAAVVLVFSTQGYYLIINYSGRAKDPRKDIPWVWKYIPWLLVIVYGGVGMVAGCVLPLEECANQPLTYVVQSFLPTPLVYLFVIGGACFALLSTLNGLYSSYGAVWAEAAKDGWYPKFLSTVNKNGQPVILMTIAAVIAVLPMLLDFSIQTITNNIILLTLFVDIFPCIAAFILPSKYPDAWKNSVVHMKKGAFICLMSVSLIVQIACAYWSARSMSITAVIISLACDAVCFIYGYFRGSKEEVKCPELSKEFLES